MTFATMYGNILTKTGRSDQTTLAKSVINKTLGEITSQGTFKWMEATGTFDTVASTESYCITTVHSNVFASYKSFLSIRQTMTSPYTTLTYFDPSEYDLYLPNPSGDPEGSPIYFTEKAGYWYLYPIPDSIYTMTVTYYKKHATLSGDSDALTVADDWLSVIEDLATVRFFFELRYPQQASAYANVSEVNRRLKNLIDRDRVKGGGLQMKKSGSCPIPIISYPWLCPFVKGD
jgi:hypothetical protein